MIKRFSEQEFSRALYRPAAVDRLAPPHIRKTTLARSIADEARAWYLDL